jgi:hypothetical protein
MLADEEEVVYFMDDGYEQWKEAEWSFTYVCAQLASWRRIVVEEDGPSWSIASLAN